MVDCFSCSKPAQLENLEIDQYIWGILSGTSNSEYPPEEVTIDSQANWKPSNMTYNIKVSAGCPYEDWSVLFFGCSDVQIHVRFYFVDGRG